MSHLLWGVGSWWHPCFALWAQALHLQVSSRTQKDQPAVYDLQDTICYSKILNRLQRLLTRWRNRPIQHKTHPYSQSYVVYCRAFALLRDSYCNAGLSLYFRALTVLPGSHCTAGLSLYVLQGSHCTYCRVLTVHTAGLSLYVLLGSHCTYYRALTALAAGLSLYVLQGSQCTYCRALNARTAGLSLHVLQGSHCTCCRALTVRTAGLSRYILQGSVLEGSHFRCEVINHVGRWARGPYLNLYLAIRKILP